jgi:hypothetical protein
MKIVKIGKNEFNVHDASEHEINEALKLVSDNCTQAKLDKAIKEVKLFNNKTITLDKYRKYLKDTVWEIQQDYFESLTTDEQNNLVESRKKAIEFIKNNKE